MTSQVRTQTAGIGFWLYLMTDCLLFASLFATYAVLHGSTNGATSMNDIVNMPYVLTQTLLLLASSLTSGIAYVMSRGSQWRYVCAWLGLTAALGMGFMTMELYEFTTLLADGASWQSSAFLSAFFTLVGTHGLHILFGLMWALVIMWHIYRHSQPTKLGTHMLLFTMFWHFLELVWICIFTFVYIIGGHA